MALIVQKYGGSSVADAEKIKNVARRVAESAAAHQLVVVVSAMGKTTDGLVGLASRITPTPEPREMDMLLATGEQVTIALLAMALHTLGLKARSLTADVCEIYTDVDGVYTADPNIVPDARKLPRVAYDEMLAIASLVAKVLQARSV